MLGNSYWRQLIIIAHEKRPWAARSGDHGSRLRLAGPTRHQGSIWAPVIIRFPRRRRPMSCCREAYTLSLLPEVGGLTPNRKRRIPLLVVQDKRPLGPGEAIRGCFRRSRRPPTQDFGQTELLDREPIKIARAHPLIASGATKQPLPAVLLTAALLKRTRASCLFAKAVGDKLLQTRDA